MFLFLLFFSLNFLIAADNPAEITSTAQTAPENPVPAQNAAPVVAVNTEANISGTLVPAVLEVTPEVQATKKEDILEGLDTLEEPDSGNWYVKRILLKKAGPKHNKIRQTLSLIEDVAGELFNKKTEYEKTLNDFYMHLGFEAAVISKRIQALSESIQKEREKTGLNEQEKNILEKLEDQKNISENLQKEILVLEQLSKTIDEAFVRLDQQVKLARSYEQQAWKSYESIADTLDDQKAKNFYFQLEGLLDNMQNIEKYIESQFTPYLDQSLQLVKDQQQKINDIAAQIQSKGVDLTQEFDFAKFTSSANMVDQKVTSSAAQPVKVKIQQGWPEYIWDTIKSPFIYIYDLIFGSHK